MDKIRTNKKNYECSDLITGCTHTQNPPLESRLYVATCGIHSWSINYEFSIIYDLEIYINYIWIFNIISFYNWVILIYMNSRLT